MLTRLAAALVLALTTAGASAASQSAAPTPRPSPLPVIYGVDVSPTVITSFSKVSAFVRTSDDVQVVAVSVGHLKPEHLERTSAGTFEGTVGIPWLPWFWHHSWVVTFTGYDLRGHQVSSHVTIDVR